MKHYSYHIPPRPAEFRNGEITLYKGFTITDNFDVTQNGKVIFRDNISIQQAKNIIDQSLAMKAKQDLGKLWKRFTEDELENGEARREYEAKQVDNYFENQLNKDYE